MIDSDVPWIPLKNKPSSEALVYYLDEDPLKEGMPLWYIPSKRFYVADTETALKQINKAIEDERIPAGIVKERRIHITNSHHSQRKEWKLLEEYNEEVITPAYLTACVREWFDENTIVMTEGISNYETICKHMQASRPGSLFASGAGSLGWGGGAAIGAKLAAPDKNVICLTGDGSYMFSVPSTVHWMSRKYKVPFLIVIYNNRGWKSPKLSTLGVHPTGIAKETNEFLVDFAPHADLSKIAEAAGGAFGKKVEKSSEVKEALREAFDAIKSGRSAVLDVYLPAITDTE